MAYRTDLALECRELIENSVPEGVVFSEEFFDNVKITRIEITDSEGEKSLGKARGKYITLELSDFRFDINQSKNDIELIAKEIRELIGEEGCVLIAGLGNRDITPDAIGPLVCDMSLATRHINIHNPEFNFRDAVVISPGVMGKTGVETGEIIKSVCDRINAKCVIAVDALASRSASRLGKTIQICNTGISPGSGVGNSRAELSQKTLGVPVIALGVPTVVDAQTIAEDLGATSVNDEMGKMMVTPREIDAVVTNISRIIALALGRAIQNDLTCDELYYLSV